MSQDGATFTQQHPSETMLHEPQPASVHRVKSALKKDPMILPSHLPQPSANQYSSNSDTATNTYYNSSNASGTSSGEPSSPAAYETSSGSRVVTTTMVTDNYTTSATKGKKKKKKKALTWDEHAIEEHDLLRGTRMKIEEPNTPYAHYDHQSDDDSTSYPNQPKTPPSESQKHAPNLAMQWDHLETRLGAVAAYREAYPSSPSASSMYSEEESEGGKRSRREKEKKKVEFSLHRKAHYDEMEALRRFRAQQHDDDEDDDDEM